MVTSVFVLDVLHCNFKVIWCEKDKLMADTADPAGSDSLTNPGLVTKLHKLDLCVLSFRSPVYKISLTFK